MSVNKEIYQRVTSQLFSKNVSLVAVSKTKPAAQIQALYDLGQRDFGENYVQEMIEKESVLPKDIRWHFIGHLQSNKVKYIAPFIHLIQGVDSFELLKEINKQAAKNNRVVDCLLQVHVAQEQTKFGLSAEELLTLTKQSKEFSNIQIKGLMGMASFSDDEQLLRSEFKILNNLFLDLQNASAPNIKAEILSMGMSADYLIAIEEGSTMVRIGSLLFGQR